MELAQTGNAYFDSKKPWKLVKTPEHRELLDSCIACSLECIKNLALVASPIIPNGAQKIWKMLGYSTVLAEGNWEKIRKTPLSFNQTLGTPEILFRKIEDEEIEAQISKMGNKGAAAVAQTFPHPPLKAPIAYDNFDALDLRVGQVLEAIKVPKSSKLLKLLVDLGFEKRTIVSGIALSYNPQDLVGRKVIVIANLAPAKIMGIESQGMILAASQDAKLELPQIQHLEPGSVIS
jgi:methionyl-tRNA synthetase